MTTEAAIRVTEDYIKSKLDTYFFSMRVEERALGSVTRVSHIRVPADYVPRHMGDWQPGGDGSQKKVAARVLSEDEFQDIHAMRQGAIGWVEIAAKYGGSISRRSNLYNRELRKRFPGTPPKAVRMKRGAGLKKWTVAEEKSLWSMHIAGCSLSEMAARLGRTKFSVEARRAAIRDRKAYEAKLDRKVA